MKTHQVTTALSLVMALLASAACDAVTDRPSDVDTLRILAIQAETPFAKPGAQVPLHMLSWDGSAAAVRSDGSRRSVQLLWIGGCTNPPGDDYKMCLPYLHEIVKRAGDAINTQQVPPETPPGVLGWGKDFTAQVPKETISSRSVADGVVYPYGSQFVFVAACAGILRPIANAEMKKFPLGCFDPDSGKQLGRDDFEIGFYPLYIYDTISNANPEIKSLTVNGVTVGKGCSENELCPSGQKCGSEATCIPVVPSCAAEDPDDCTGYLVALDVPGSSAELGTLARVPAENAMPESLWVTYYTDSGSFEKDAYTINDPNSGWNGKFNGNWRARTKGGTQSRIWAVVRDNRNGVSWRYQDVWVE